MAQHENVSLIWHGAAHYHILHEDTHIVIDPLYTRLPGETPRLTAKKEDVERIDCLLLTHGHRDHSLDFPFLVARHNPPTYAPAACLKDIGREETGSDLEFDRSRNHELEKVKGTDFEVSGIAITPYQIGTEEIDFWFLREMFIRPWRHGRPAALTAGLRWLTHHLYGNCFAFLFSFPPDGKTMLYFGNLTEQVDELASVERVDVLAIPFCPANSKWLRQSQFLINRFRPEATLVHHFDNFMNPFTLYRYMNLDEYRAAVQERSPSAQLYFSKFFKKIHFTDILTHAEK